MSVITISTKLMVQATVQHVYGESVVMRLLFGSRMFANPSCAGNSVTTLDIDWGLDDLVVDKNLAFTFYIIIDFHCCGHGHKSR